MLWFLKLRWRKSSWNEEVPVSAQTYAHSRAVMHVTRFAGLFPMAIKKSSLRWSPWLALYSFSLGLAIIIRNARGGLEDILKASNGESIQVVTKTDALVMIIVWLAYFFMVFCGYFVMNSKVAQFLQYVKCINQIDAILHTEYTKSDKYKSNLLLGLIVAYGVGICVLDQWMAYNFLGPEVGMVEITKQEIALHLSAVSGLIVQYMCRHIVFTLEKRLWLLNQHLKVQYDRMHKFGNFVPKSLRFKPPVDDAAVLVELRDAYLKLMDATSVLNDFLGVNVLIVTGCCFALLTTSSYFTILALEGKRRGRLELAFTIAVSFQHVQRILLVTEPWNVCRVQVENTKNLVCKLLALNVGSNSRKEIDSFAVALGLQPFGVSACGFFDIDRSLFTSLMDTITTYVVIFLQEQENDAVSS